jgi:hypothetical protein
VRALRRWVQPCDFGWEVYGLGFGLRHQPCRRNLNRTHPPAPCSYTGDTDVSPYSAKGRLVEGRERCYSLVRQGPWGQTSDLRCVRQCLFSSWKMPHLANCIPGGGTCLCVRFAQMCGTRSPNGDTGGWEGERRVVGVAGRCETRQAARRTLPEALHLVMSRSATKTFLCCLRRHDEEFGGHISLFLFL